MEESKCFSAVSENLQENGVPTGGYDLQESKIIMGTCVAALKICMWVIGRQQEGLCGESTKG